MAVLAMTVALPAGTAAVSGVGIEGSGAAYLTMGIPQKLYKVAPGQRACRRPASSSTMP
jgi:hypothetical protein